MDFYPFNKFKLYVEDEGELKYDKEIKFRLIESHQILNDFSTLSDVNLQEFVQAAEKACAENVTSQNFGIMNQQQQVKNIIEFQMQSKQLRNLLIAVQRVQAT